MTRVRHQPQVQDVICETCLAILVPDMQDARTQHARGSSECCFRPKCNTLEDAAEVHVGTYLQRHLGIYLTLDVIAMNKATSSEIDRLGKL